MKGTGAAETAVHQALVGLLLARVALLPFVALGIRRASEAALLILDFIACIANFQ